MIYTSEEEQSRSDATRKSNYSIMSEAQTLDKSQYVCELSIALTFDDKSIVRQSCRDKIRDLCERVSKVKETDKDREAMFIAEIGRLTYFLEML